MNEFARLEKLAERLKLEYPKGTRIELDQMGIDPRPIESGTRGTVDHVDDQATIHCTFDNGRRLGLIYDEDKFHKLTSYELKEEESERIQRIYIQKVNQEVMPQYEWMGMKNAYKYGDMSCPTDFLKKLHEKFLEVYGTDPLSRDNFFVTVPAVVKAANGNLYVALLDLDCSSSGEHWGTSFFTPEGVLDQADDREDIREIVRSFIPYRYWYTPHLEIDHHVDWDDCPDEVRQMLSEATGEDFSIKGGMTY